MALTRPKYSNIVDTDYKASCRVVTTTNITLSGGAPSSYDSVSFSTQDRILVAGQNVSSQNGIYVVTVVGSGSNGTWARALDADSNSKITAGLQCAISEGTYGGHTWRLTTPDPITLGTTGLTFLDAQSTAGGSDKQLQFNNSGTLQGASSLSYNSANTSVISTGNLFATTIYTTQLLWAANANAVTLTGNINPAIYIGNTAVTTANTLVDSVLLTGNSYVTWTLFNKDVTNSRYRALKFEGYTDGTSFYSTEMAIGNNSPYKVATFVANVHSGSIKLWAVGDSNSVYANYERRALGSSTPLGYINNFGPQGIAGTIAETGGNIKTTATTTSTSTTTGALQVAGGAGIAGNLYVGGDTVIGGNLTVLGTNEIINSTVVAVADLNITLANGAGSAAAADGGGITIAGANATWNYTATTNAWTANKNVSAPALYTGGVYWSGNNAALHTGINYLVSSTPPAGVNYGDKWYDTSSDILFEWQTGDGATGFWVDISSPVTYANNAGILAANVVSANSITTTGNIKSTSGNLIFSSGYANITYTPSTATLAAINVTAKDTQGGTGYADFLRATNTTASATNPNKFFRLNSTGGVEIINSAYTATLLSLSDAGALSVSSSISIGGKKAVNGPAFRAYVSVGQTITSSGQQKVTFGTENFDTDNNFASSTFTPTVEGYYQLNSTVRMDGGTSGTGEVMIVLYKNGSEYSRGTNESGTEQGANFYSMQVSDIAYANGTTDYFEVYVQQTSGASRNTTAGSTISYFSGCMVRGA